MRARQHDLTARKARLACSASASRIDLFEHVQGMRGSAADGAGLHRGRGPAHSEDSCSTIASTSACRPSITIGARRRDARSTTLGLSSRTGIRDFAARGGVVGVWVVECRERGLDTSAEWRMALRPSSFGSRKSNESRASPMKSASKSGRLSVRVRDFRIGDLATAAELVSSIPLWQRYGYTEGRCARDLRAAARRRDRLKVAVSGKPSLDWPGCCRSRLRRFPTSRSSPCTKAPVTAAPERPSWKQRRLAAIFCCW